MPVVGTDTVPVLEPVIGIAAPAVVAPDTVPPVIVPPVIEAPVKE
jgi:hypothetical protein